MTFLFAALLVAAAVVLITVQTVARHRRLVRREQEGRSALPRSTWIVFSASALFLIFAVFVLPALLRT